MKGGTKTKKFPLLYNNTNQQKLCAGKFHRDNFTNMKTIRYPMNAKIKVTINTGIA